MGGCWSKTVVRRHARSLQRKTEAFTVKHCPRSTTSSLLISIQLHAKLLIKVMQREREKKNHSTLRRPSDTRWLDSVLHQMAVNLTWQNWNVLTVWSKLTEAKNLICTKWEQKCCVLSSPNFIFWQNKSNKNICFCFGYFFSGNLIKFWVFVQ